MRAKSFSVIWLAILLLLACEQKQGLPPADIKPSSTVSPISVQPSQTITTSTPSVVSSSSTPIPVSTANLCPITTKISFDSPIDLFLVTSFPVACRENISDFKYLFQLKSPESKPIYLYQEYHYILDKCALPPDIKEEGEYNIRVEAHLKNGQAIEGNTVTVTIKKASAEDCSRKGGGASLEGRYNSGRN